MFVTKGRKLSTISPRLALSEDEAGFAIKELENKARQLPFASKYEKIVTQLFVAQDPPTGAVSLDWCEK